VDGILLYCSLILVFGLISSIIVAKIHIKKTAKITVQISEGISINILAGIAAIVIWLSYTVNEFATVIGTLYLLGCTIVSIIVFSIYLTVKKKRMVNK